MSESQLDYLAKTVEILSAENAKLREELADCTRSHPHESMSKACELRTEIARLGNALANAEAKLKAASKQEQVNDAACVESDGCPTEKAVLQRYWREAHQPADVQELQQHATDWRKKYEKEFARCRAWTKDYGEACQQLNGRITELQHKLAEQQGVFRKIQYLMGISDKTCESLQYSTEELTALLAAEYQRGRADEREESEKEEPSAFMSGEILHKHKDLAGGYQKLYTRALAAQKPLSEDAIDAKRYRFLKSVMNGKCHPPTATLCSGNGWTVQYETYGDRYKPVIRLTNETLDSAIDGAIEAAHGITENKEG